MFLTKNELTTVALPEVINIITTGDDTIVEQIIAESIDLMSTYLRNYYDVEAVFAASGEERSKIVLKYLKDIVVHEVYIRRSHQYNEVAKMRYDEAMLWLDKVTKGEVNLDLPAPPAEDPNERDGGYLHLGSRTKYPTGL